MRSLYGSFYIDLRIGGEIIDSREIDKILICEKLNEVIKYELKLKIFNKKLLYDGINANTSVELQIAKDKKSIPVKHQIQIQRLKMYPNLDGSGQYIINLVGISKKFMPYFTSTEIKCYDKISTEVIKDVFTNLGLNVSSAVSSNDKMKWIQANTTHKNFVNDVLLHAGDKTFVLRMAYDTVEILSIEDIMQKKVDFTFASYVGNKKDRIMYSSIIVADNSCVNSFIDTGNRKINELDIISGDFKEYTTSFEKYGAKTIYENNDMGKLYGWRSIDKDNMHSKYNENRVNNLSKWNQLNNIDIEVYTDGQIDESILSLVKTGAKCKLEVVSPEITQGRREYFKGNVDTQYTGDYIVTKKSDIYQINNYQQIFGLSKEGVKQV